jgi:hypothetical protein
MPKGSKSKGNNDLLKKLQVASSTDGRQPSPTGAKKRKKPKLPSRRTK